MKVPFLTPKDISAIQTALGAATAGPLDGAPAWFEDQAEEAHRKVSTAPPRSVWVPFSQLELSVLHVALRNGMGDDALNELGLRSDQKKAAAAAANRLKDAGNIGGPVFG